MMRKQALGVACAVLLCACASAPTRQTREIHVIRETTPVLSAGDAADDPAVWRNPDDPARSLIVTTDKAWGLNVYGLDGALVASAPAGLVNNVDLRADVQIQGDLGILVAASDRSDDSIGKIAFYALEISPVGLRHLAHVAVPADGVGDVYGFCLWRRARNDVHAIIAYNNGDVREYALDLSGAAPAARLVRDVKLDSRAEGCVVDDRTGLLYVGEEERGVWRIDLRSSENSRPHLFAPVDGVRLVADVEGLAIAPRGRTGGYLIASSQADSAGGRIPSAFAIYDLETGRFVRTLQAVGSDGVDGVSDTDGLEFAPGDFGAPFENGVFVVQDGDNAPDNQNFKLIPGGALLDRIAPN